MYLLANVFGSMCDDDYHENPTQLLEFYLIKADKNVSEFCFFNLVVLVLHWAGP